MTRSADARAAWVPPMWPLTVSGPQWGWCSLLCSSWTHTEPLHKAGKKDKREHQLITAAKPNKWIMTSTQSGWSKIWSYIKNAMVDQGSTSCIITPKTLCSCRPSVSHHIITTLKKRMVHVTHSILTLLYYSLFDTIEKKLCHLLIVASIMKLNNLLIKCLWSGFHAEKNGEEHGDKVMLSGNMVNWYAEVECGKKTQVDVINVTRESACVHRICMDVASSLMDVQPEMCCKML